MRIRPPGACFAISLIALLSACGPLPPLKAYGGPDQLDANLAVLDWSATGDIYVLAVDGQDTVVVGDDFGGGEHEQAKMLPGRHNIRYGRCGARRERRVMFWSEFVRPCHPIIGDLDVQAGHHYLVRSGVKGESVEIVDAATQQVMTFGRSAPL
jgi:hypothetical protein